MGADFASDCSVLLLTHGVMEGGMGMATIGGLQVRGRNISQTGTPGNSNASVPQYICIQYACHNDGNRVQ